MAAFNSKFDRKLGKFVSIDEETKQPKSSIEQTTFQSDNTVQQFLIKFDKEEGVWRQYDDPKSS
jgi:hypothetical protein